MSTILNIFWLAFESCVDWTNQIFIATDAAGLVVSVFIIVLCVSLFLMPIRGVGVAAGSRMRDMGKQAIHKRTMKKKNGG